MPRKPALTVLPDWEPLLTLEQCAARLQVPLATLYYWRTRGAFPKGTVVGKHVRITERDFVAWYAAQPSAA